MGKKLRHITLELREHLPFTILSVSAGIIILGILTFIASLLGAKEIKEPSQELFHVFHPLHMLFSAAATTAMFWRHENKFLKTVIVGFFGAVVICGLSDIAIPYVAGFLLGVKMELHICIIQHPMLILPFAFMGIVTGLIVPKEIQSTIFTHTAHVFVSSMASILYLVSFGLVYWVHYIGMVFFYIVLAVVIPCCTSDIVFPLLAVRKD